VCAAGVPGHARLEGQILAPDQEEERPMPMIDAYAAGRDLMAASGRLLPPQSPQLLVV
jgi:hypothetical protein